MAAALQNTEPSNCTAIQEYFSNATIFITGGTGFLGKILVEKLLRTCYNLKNIYLLVRPKKGKSCAKRLEEFFNNPLFNRLKLEQPTALKKLCIVTGDCELPQLGLHLSDQEMLISQVTCIFHVAATVRFDEKLQKAAYINVRATRDLLNLARQMHNLKSLVHVSTAFSHCTNNLIEEKFYDVPITAKDLLALAENANEEHLTQLTPILIKPWPNTYTFTKAVAEDLIRNEGADLPIAIVRPSIVIASVKEPVEGWIDNFYGPTGLFVGIIVGLVRTTIYSEDLRVDQVPVDYTVNNIISAAWKIGVERESNKTNRVIPIFNYVSGPENPITWKNCHGYALAHAKELPSIKKQWHTVFKVASNKYIFFILHFLLHLLPGYIIDTFLLILGQKPKLVNMYNKIKVSVCLVAYFTTREFNFKNENTQNLWKSLSEEDKNLFEFSMRNFEWNSYCYTYVYGARLYLLKEKIETLPQAKRKALKLKIAHYVLVSIMMYFVFKFILSIYF